MNELEQWHGTDANNETSLLEYGLLMRFVPKEKGSQWQVVYAMNHDENGDGKMFGSGWTSEQEIADLMSGRDWIKGKDIGNFLEFNGCSTVEEFLKMPMVHKLADLFQYWGHENIMGADYYPWSKEHAMFMTGLAKEDEKTE